MMQLKHFRVVALCNISGGPTALLIIFIWVSGLVQPTKHMFVTNVKKFGIMLDHQSRANLWQYLGCDYVGIGCSFPSRFH